jgi:hypothetical protein
LGSHLGPQKETVKSGRGKNNTKSQQGMHASACETKIAEATKETNIFDDVTQAFEKPLTMFGDRTRE